MAAAAINKPNPRDAALAPWLVRSSTAIARRLRDARSHAEAGRLVDAAARLDDLELELQNTVLGPAREKFFYQAFADNAAELDPSIVDPDVVPTAAGAAVAVTHPILGSDHRRAIRSHVDEARHGLKLAHHATWGNPSTATAAHATWEIRHRERIGRGMEGMLSNAQIALHNAVMHLMVRADLR
jgi:hypothetical protein